MEIRLNRGESCLGPGSDRTGLVRVMEGAGLIRVREGAGPVRVREGAGLVRVRDDD